MNISSEEESTDDDDDETGASVLPLDINPTSPGGQRSPMTYSLSKPEGATLQSVFFDLKSLGKWP
ncbi:hypothetical protein L345_07570, partial [Ophiophagus hannah]